MPSRTRIVVDLPRAVRAEEAVDLTLVDGEIKTVKRANIAEMLVQIANVDDGGH